MNIKLNNEICFQIVKSCANSEGDDIQVMYQRAYKLLTPEMFEYFMEYMRSQYYLEFSDDEANTEVLKLYE